MSSSYSSLDWVLSRWAHFTVRRFICVYVCVFCVCFLSTAYVLYYCNTVRWTGWDWSLILRTYLSLGLVLWHCWLGHLTRKNPSPIWPVMCLVGCWTLLYYSIWCHVVVVPHCQYEQSSSLVYSHNKILTLFNWRLIEYSSQFWTVLAQHGFGSYRCVFGPVPFRLQHSKICSVIQPTGHWLVSDSSGKATDWVGWTEISLWSCRRPHSRAALMWCDMLSVRTDMLTDLHFPRQVWSDLSCGAIDTVYLSHKWRVNGPSAVHTMQCIFDASQKFLFVAYLANNWASCIYCLTRIDVGVKHPYLPPLLDNRS